MTFIVLQNILRFPQKYEISKDINTKCFLSSKSAY